MDTHLGVVESKQSCIRLNKFKICFYYKLQSNSHVEKPHILGKFKVNNQTDNTVEQIKEVPKSLFVIIRILIYNPNWLEQ